MSKTVVCTLADCSTYSDFQLVYDQTRDSIVEYAQRIGSEFVELTGQNTRDGDPHWMKFDLFTQLIDRGFDRILYVDADVYIRRSAPSFFDSFGDADAALYDERELWRGDPIGVRLIGECQWFDSDYPAVVDDYPYYNSGVMFFRASVVKPMLEELISITRQAVWPRDQTAVNVGLWKHNTNVCNIGFQWNGMLWSVHQEDWFSSERLSKAYFVHAAGIGGAHAAGYGGTPAFARDRANAIREIRLRDEMR